MNRCPAPEHIRRAAIADYLRCEDSQAVVAARHGVPKSTLGRWVNGIRRDQRALPAGEWVPNGRGTVVWVVGA